MSRLPVDVDRVALLAEESLFVVGEVKAFLTKEERLVRYLGGLDEADQLEEAQAQADVEVAITRLRAARGRLTEVQHRKAQKREIRNEILADFGVEAKDAAHGARVIALNAAAAGVKHINAELLQDCSAAERGRV